MSLAAALESAAAALSADADAIRPANGDPVRLLASLGSEGAGRVAAWLLAHEPDDAEELVDAWLDLEGGPAALLAVDEASLPKPGRKLLRRARHQLKSKGVAVPEPAPAPTVARLPRVEEALAAAAVTAPDPLGACLAYLVESHPTGGARLFEIALAEGRGILGVDVYAAGRSKVRAFLRQVTAGRRLAAVDVPPASARALVARIAAAQPADRPLPAGYREWQAQLRDAPAGAQTPGELARAALEPAPDLAGALALVAEGRVGPWPERDVLERVAKRIQEIGESALIVAGGTRREQVEGVIAAAVEEAYAGEHGARTAALFRHAAYVFWQRDDEAAARAALAAAERFESAPPAENPLARALFERPLQGLLERLDQAAEAGAETPSLLVTPGTGAGPGAIR
ncbi:MAG TPA: hypothetical protein VHQ66_08925 [Myxococcota bacterium]|nr:hypothetical protein [Myxococcota bacterium]